MHPVSCTNTHHNITDLGWLKIQKYKNLNIMRMEHKISMKSTRKVKMKIQQDLAIFNS